MIGDYTLMFRPVLKTIGAAAIMLMFAAQISAAQSSRIEETKALSSWQCRYPSATRFAP
jgi:hypothetical protein